ncbi:MAG: carboxymuconolactone decarboxylase family protein [Coriobacteriia bacterium]|nr:carboxymuconolactone decarboxylase family protein [Coriobacteriia bacterium]
MEPIRSNYMYMVKDGGEIGAAYFDFFNLTAEKTALDPKAFQFVYLAYLAADGVTEGIRRHVMEAKEAGATRAEIQSVILTGLAVSGAKLQDVYRAAMETYDSLD